MSSSARSPSSADATTSANMNGGASTIGCAARAAAVVSAVWLGPVKTVTPVKITTSKHIVSQNKKFSRNISMTIRLLPVAKRKLIVRPAGAGHRRRAGQLPPGAGHPPDVPARRRRQALPPHGVAGCRLRAGTQLISEAGDCGQHAFSFLAGKRATVRWTRSIHHEEPDRDDHDLRPAGHGGAWSDTTVLSLARFGWPRGPGRPGRLRRLGRRPAQARAALPAPHAAGRDRACVRPRL